MSALPPGARLNSYTVIATLGAGGFGITYRAREDFTNRDVAIKEYLPTAFAMRDRDGDGVRPLSEGAAEDFNWGLDRFRQEAKLLIGFRHPNIVPVLAYFEANGTGYLVMAFQDGASLGDILEARSVLSEAETVRVTVPLLDAVEEVHRRGFLHRDIKPDNVFVRRDGVPVLLDFGAARQALGEHSRNFTTLLTEGYAPFEQYAGTGNQGPWSDIYALAAVMFRCLLGKAPVEAPRRAVARLRGEGDPLAVDLADLQRRVSPGLAFAIGSGLRVVEQERPGSVAAFRDLLVQALPPHDSRTSAGSPTLVPDATLRANPPRVRRRRRSAAFAALSIVVLAGAGVAALMGDYRNWLPEFFREAGNGRSAATASPPLPKPSPPAEPRQTGQAPVPNDTMQKGLAEHQQRQLDQVEAERRQWEAHKAAEAERKRAENETARDEAERKQQEDRDRQAEADKARAEAERRREEQARAREAEEQARRRPDARDMPARTGRESPRSEPPPRLGGPGTPTPPAYDEY